MAAEHQYCTFELDGQSFGIEVLTVQEIIRHQAMTRVPLAPATVTGLMNLRGQIVTAIDLRRRLEMPDRPAGQLPINVVVHTDDGAVSLLVDEIGDVETVDDAAFERPPETLRGTGRELIRGTYKLKERLLHILDPKRVVDRHAGRRDGERIE